MIRMNIMEMKTMFVAVVLGILAFSLPLNAATWYVAKGGDDTSAGNVDAPFATIQKAINVAKEGDVIYVGPGTYSPISLPSSSTKPHITIIGVNGAGETFIDGRGEAQCVNLTRDRYSSSYVAFTNTVIRGFTIRNGYKPGSTGAGVHGGTYINCIIERNAAFYFAAIETALLKNCVIRFNHSEEWIDTNPSGVPLPPLPLGSICGRSRLENCLIYANESYDGKYLFGDDWDAYNCTIVGNSGHLNYDKNSCAYNSIICGNTNATGALITYTKGVNCYTEDPHFVDPEHGDYRLAGDSPCIDAGNNAYAIGDADLAGNPRISNGVVDIGAYEFIPGPKPDGSYTETIGDYIWHFTIVDGEATIDTLERVDEDTQALCSIVVPNSIGGCPVTGIGEAAFIADVRICSISLPVSLKKIGDNAFLYCELKEVIIPDSVVELGYACLGYCSSLTNITVGSGVTNIAQAAFADCGGLQTICFKGNAPYVQGEEWGSAYIFSNTPESLIVYVEKGSIGWNGPGSTTLPDKWPLNDSTARRIAYMQDGPEEVQTHTVVFEVGEYGTRTGGGELMQTVQDGCAAIAPTVISTNGLWRFAGWDCDFNNITSDLVVTAKYERMSVTAIIWRYTKQGSRGNWDLPLEKYTSSGETNTIRIIYRYGEGGSSKQYLSGAQIRLDGWFFVQENQVGTWGVLQGYDDYMSLSIDDVRLIENVTYTKSASAVWLATGGWHRFTIVCGDTGGDCGCVGTSPEFFGRRECAILVSIEGGDYIPFEDSFVFGNGENGPTEDGSYGVGFSLGTFGQRTGGGELSQIVASNTAAIAPTVISTNGLWRFAGWDCDFSAVTSNMTVKAQFVEVADYSNRLSAVVWRRTTRGGCGAWDIPICDYVFMGYANSIKALYRRGAYGDYGVDRELLARSQNRLDGWFHVPIEKAGLWMIRQGYDDYMSLDLDGVRIVENTSYTEAKYAEWRATPGWHRFTIVYGDTGGDCGVVGRGLPSVCRWAISISVKGGDYISFEDEFVFADENTTGEINDVPVPDLEISNLSAPTSLMPGDAVTVSFVERNIGVADAQEPWKDVLYLVSPVDGNFANGISERVRLGEVEVSADLPQGAEAHRQLSVVVPQLIRLSGSVGWLVCADGDDSVVEGHEDKAEKEIQLAASAGALLGKRLYLESESSEVREDNATGVRFTLRRSGSVGDPLEIDVSSGPIGQVEVPQKIVIPADHASANFFVKPNDNVTVEGTRLAVVTVSASGGYGAATCPIAIVDNEVPKLTVTVEKSTIRENDGAIQVTVTREIATDSHLAVSISGLSTPRCSCPASVVIPAGKQSETFEIRVNDNEIAEIAASLTLRASAAGYSSGEATFVLEDDDIPGVTLSVSPAEVSEGAGGRAIYATLTRSDTEHIQKPLTIRLFASQEGQLVLPASVVIPAYTMAVRFAVGVVDNALDDGDRDVTISGAIVIDSCGCNGQPSNGDVIQSVVRINDNDGPVTFRAGGEM